MTTNGALAAGGCNAKPRNCSRQNGLFVAAHPNEAAPTAIFGDQSSAVAEMGDRDHNTSQKRGPAAFMGPGLIQCGLGRDLLPYQVASSSIQPFGYNRRPKNCMGVGVPFFWG